MERDSELAAALKEKVLHYERSGYIEKLTESQFSEEFPHVWYLPFFPGVNPNKPGKVRIVWDAAAKTAGVSLTSFLLTGPDLLTSLQVWMNWFDQHCLNMLLWRNGELGRNPDVYVMKVMTSRREKFESVELGGDGESSRSVVVHRYRYLYLQSVFKN